MAASPLLADASSVTLTGVVKDQAGGALPGATVTVRNQGQGTSSTGITDAHGEYRVPLLRPDTYTVKVTIAGFQEESRADIQLAVGSTARVDFSMRLTNVLAEVTVTAEVPLVDPTTSQVGFNIAPKQIQTLPLNGRNYLELALLAPGVSFARDGNSPVSFGAQEGRGSSTSRWTASTTTTRRSAARRRTLPRTACRSSRSSPHSSRRSTARPRVASSTSSRSRARTTLTALPSTTSAATRWTRTTSLPPTSRRSSRRTTWAPRWAALS